MDGSAIIDYNGAVRKPAHTSLTIRKLPPGVKQRLRLRAARHGRSLEAEAREILRTAAGGAEAAGDVHLFDRIHRRFARLGGVKLDLPPRGPDRPPPDFRAKS